VDFTRPVQDGPLSHGFDTYFGDDVPNFPPRAFLQDDRLLSAPSVPKPQGMFGVAGPTTPGWDLAAVMPRLTAEAVAFVTEAAAAKEPFFLYFALTAPHTPIAPAPEFAGTTAAGAYGHYVAQVDATVGAILDALEDAGCAKETLVVFTSDNGSPARDGAGMAGALHGVTAKFGHVPNGPWRGAKADIWEAGHRVPLLVRWPGKVPAGTTTDALVGLQDLYATLSEASGAVVPPGNAEDSLSFRAVLARPKTSGRSQLVHHSLDGTFALRAGRWKLVAGNLGSGGFSAPQSMPPPDGGPGGQLYDLEIDPTESDNLWADHPQIVRELEQALETVRSGP
jgi:arylsulfatase A-like enzyme